MPATRARALATDNRIECGPAEAGRQTAEARHTPHRFEHGLVVRLDAARAHQAHAAGVTVGVQGHLENHVATLALLDRPRRKCLGQNARQLATKSAVETRE